MKATPLAACKLSTGKTHMVIFIAHALQHWTKKVLSLAAWDRHLVTTVPYLVLLGFSL